MSLMYTLNSMGLGKDQDKEMIWKKKVKRGILSYPQFFATYCSSSSILTWERVEKAEKHHVCLVLMGITMY